MEAKFLMTSNGGSSLCGDEELTWWFVILSSGIGMWGATAQEKFKVLPCRVKVQGLWSGNDNACALFPSWSCRLWRS
jgi:hypothetical protein